MRVGVEEAELAGAAAAEAALLTDHVGLALAAEVHLAAGGAVAPVLVPLEQREALVLGEHHRVVGEQALVVGRRGRRAAAVRAQRRAIRLHVAVLHAAAQVAPQAGAAEAVRARALALPPLGGRRAAVLLLSVAAAAAREARRRRRLHVLEADAAVYRRARPAREGQRPDAIANAIADAAAEVVVERGRRRRRRVIVGVKRGDVVLHVPQRQRQRPEAPGRRRVERAAAGVAAPQRRLWG
mmetsp:Transcript_28937/g.92502  ORF Transcript_28937/g.92502 Transcript_28937/m.92502 type:complete len:240 (+) Transcript_28937:849-1568(+)